MAKLETDPTYQGSGTVLRSQGNDWIRHTRVFVPEQGFTTNLDELTILLWFHGYYVEGTRHLFYQEATNLLPAVVSAKRDILLVAPKLGWYQDASNTTYDAGALGGGKCEKYLDQVLAALTRWYVDSFVGGDEIFMEGGKFPTFRLGNLYVAGHSGGGSGITSAVASLGGYKDRLRQCWGFDCLYGSGSSWYEWAKAHTGVPLYFYYGWGTRPAVNGDVLGFWRRVYGSPRNQIAATRRLSNVFLAPALPGTELDAVAFQSAEQLKARAKPGNRYEEVRQKVDPYLDNDDVYWSKIHAEGIKGHYEVVSELLGPRIRQSVP